jgi:hypothetical protein
MFIVFFLTYKTKISTQLKQKKPLKFTFHKEKAEALIATFKNEE